MIIALSQSPSRWVVILLSLLLATGCGIKQQSSTTKIIGGDNNFPPNSPVPYSTVAITNSTVTSVCTGTIISDDLIVTASHCFAKITDAGQLRIFYGADLFQADSDELHTAKEYLTFNPSGYSASLFPNYDVAWIRLSESIPSDRQPVEILRDASKLVRGKEIVAAGYGVTTFTCPFGSDCVGRLNEVKVKLDQFYNSNEYHDLIVVRGDSSHGQCHGDSGGPTFTQVDGKWYLVGATNGRNKNLTPDVNKGCASGYEVNTFLGAYADWIEKSTGETLPHSSDNLQNVTPLDPSDILSNR